MNDSALNLPRPGPTRHPWLPALLGGAALACCPICNNIGLVDGSAHPLDPASDRVEKVDGKFKLVRVTAAPGSGPP
jgi:hypothetical protein